MRILFGALCLALAAALLPRVAHASFEEMALGARAMGMSDAMTAVSDDLSAMTINPATLGQLRRAQLEAGSRRLFNVPAGLKDVDGMALGAAVPLDAMPANGTLGVSWSYDNIGQASLDRALALTYATRGWREIGLATLDVGTSLKDLTRSGRAVPGHVSKVAADLGTFLRLSDDKGVGVSILNVNGPRTDLLNEPDRAPVTFKAGYAQTVRRFMVAMDVTKREPSFGYRGTFSGALGFEYVFATPQHGSFALRTGQNFGGVGRAWSLGAGWRAFGARLDYALRVPVSGGTRWSHAVSLSYRFGAWDPEAEYERMLSGEIDYRKGLARKLEEAESQQGKLAAELKSMREEMERLRQEIARRGAETDAAQGRLRSAREQLRLKELERRRAQAQTRLERLQKEREELRQKDKEGLYREDWNGYLDLKRQGASDLVLTERLKQILRQFKGTSVDLAEANKELQRLLRQ